MRRILSDDDNRIGEWVTARAGGDWVPGSARCIGLLENEKLVAGVMYDLYNGANMCLHVASDLHARAWSDERFRWAMFHYPFEHVGVKRLTGIFPSANIRVQQLALRLGFEFEAALKDAHSKGDLLVYRMYADKCPWIRIDKEPQHGQRIERAGNA